MATDHDGRTDSSRVVVHTGGDARIKRDSVEAEKGDKLGYNAAMAAAR